MTSDRARLERELHAIRFPLSAQAVRAYGSFWKGDYAHALLLDWATIAVALDATGYLVGGATIAGVRFHRVTWRFCAHAAERDEQLGRLLGKGWAKAAVAFILRDVGGRPSLVERWNVASVVRVPGVQTFGSRSFAFRFLDEPTPWSPRPHAGRRVHGRVPTAWQTLPWSVPTDLEERPPREPDQPDMRVREEDETADVDAAHRLFRRAARLAAAATTPSEVHAHIKVVRSVAANFPDALVLQSAAATYVHRLWARYDELVMDEIRCQQEHYDRLKRQRILDDQRAQILENWARLAKRLHDEDARRAEVARILEQQRELERALHERGRVDERTR